jgi:CubicO group peptidase (beta-lactamase class C family)
MIKKTLIVFLTITLTLNLLGIDSIDKEVREVESGLRSPIMFENDNTWNIRERMRHYGVPGVSVAVIKNYKIHWIRSYGVADKENMKPVNPNTLFQACSISKPVAAYGALKMVEQNLLSLDEPVNNKLEVWKIPTNEITKRKPVALKHLLNHSAGLTVHGFDGYPSNTPLPNILQILEGIKPANSEPVIVNVEPETEFRYSGGGFTVMQKLISDVAEQPFPELMRELVLAPTGMDHSTYEQPLPAEKLKFAAAGYLPNGSAVKGKRYTYPEMAAAGLWSTAEDLAKFAIDIQLAIKTNSSKVLSQSMTERMLTPFVNPEWGLGMILTNKNDEHYFGHGGLAEGFRADFIAHKTRGYGAVIMTNAENREFIDEMKRSIAFTYQWDNFLEPVLRKLSIDEKELQRIVGRYVEHEGVIT